MKPIEVGALMTREVVTARYGTPFKEVVRLLDEHRIGGLPVIGDDGTVIGVISATDLVPHQAGRSGVRHRFSPRARRAAARSRARTAGGIMTAPAVTVRADATATEAARLMAARRVQRLPVVDEENRLAGIVTRHDLLHVFLRPDEEILRAVRQEVLLDTLWLVPQTIDVAVSEGVVSLTGRLERRSEIPVAVGMTRRLDGVVDVVDHLTYRIDDTRLRPAEQALHGVADDWLRKL
ncbi:CBS domain-containing protein [Streptomyces niveiscabiei]|uniref:CBS domain-containing protein n=1 Tax=Streptomyces niveiscabiei TaxID=164115 RepID=UPI0029AEA6A7|nr:CBS domain-containing protein [Streptomyces niveiscabiei]MDX3386436.1 CBS domain-containing protein [Streptomyces niveiscabiei]